MEKLAIPRGVRAVCDALGSLGVIVRPEVLVSSAPKAAAPGAPPDQLSSGCGDDEHFSTDPKPRAASMELWKALHDLVIAAVCIRDGKSLPPHALAAAWSQISKAGPQAVRFDAIQAMIQVQMRDFGYRFALSPSCTASELLRAFCWLVAKCKVLRRHADARCAEAVFGAPLLPAKGSQLWAAAARGDTPGEPNGSQSRSIPSKNSSRSDLHSAMYHISAECGRLWHVARELSAAEERRTLLLRQLYTLQVPLRPAASRMLRPTELEAQLRSEDPEMPGILDTRIAKVKAALALCADAVAFWEWCAQNVPLPLSEPRESLGAAVSAQGDLAELRVDVLIRDAFGLEVRKPSSGH